MLLSYPYIKYPKTNLKKKYNICKFFLRGENTVGLTVSVNGAWQKRGSGRSFDSLSGSFN